MTLAGFSLRSVAHYRSRYLLGILSVAVMSAVLTGGLLVGDSVSASLERIADLRLGRTDFALHVEHRWIRRELAREIDAAVDSGVIGVLKTLGAASAGGLSVGGVDVLGVSDSFFLLAAEGAWDGPPPILRDRIVINRRVAERLSVEAGDTIVVRVERARLLPGDTPLAMEDLEYATLRLPVGAILDDTQLGRFSLKAHQASPLLALVSADVLGDAIGRPGKVNLLLVDAGGRDTLDSLNDALRRHLRLADLQISATVDEPTGNLRLSTERVFFDPEVARGLLGSGFDVSGFVTYFVNTLQSGGREQSYSFVTGPGEAVGIPGLGDHDIAVSTWLRDQLDVAIGDPITLRYYSPEVEEGLVEKERTFLVRWVFTMDSPAADPGLMPSIPGVAGAVSCRTWRPGIPIDLSLIRDEDEEYWRVYGGAPRAVVSKSAALQMWSSVYGSYTGFRVAAGLDALAALEEALRTSIDASALGLEFRDVRSRALDSAGGGVNFGQLFVALSMFVMGSAVVLTVLLMAMLVSRRRDEFELLGALGFRPGAIYATTVIDGAFVVMSGAVLGGLMSPVYTAALLRGLRRGWYAALGSAEVGMAVNARTVATGTLLTVVVGILAAAGVGLRLRPVHGGHGQGRRGEGIRPATTLRIVAVVSGFWAVLGGGLVLAEALGSVAGFFMIGGALLVLLLSVGGLATLRPWGGGSSLASAMLRNVGHRRGRSLANAATLACAVFTVVSVGSHRMGDRSPDRRSSGTGGFSSVVETSVPIRFDLTTVAGLAGVGLSPEDGLEFVPFRVRDGEDASCLNLNRVLEPRILGVKEELLDSRGSFTFAAVLPGYPKEWSILDAPAHAGAIPAVADQTVITWALGLRLGEEITVRGDRGNSVRLQLVGALQNSVFQGNVIISEERFRQVFPEHSGARFLLVDQGSWDTSGLLTRVLRPYGAETEDARARLARFDEVQNTYLAIFGVLGGLGLLIGSFGLGAITARNVADSRGEIGLLRAVGFGGIRLLWMVSAEQVLPAAYGAVCGAAAATVAVVPSLLSGAQTPPVGWIVGVVLAVVMNAMAWSLIAAGLGMRRGLLTALRSE